MNSPNRSLCGALAFLASSVAADIPGLFVIQEAKIVDPGATAASARTNFGLAQIGVIGDIDKNGVQDLVMGAPLQDAGVIYFQTLDASGKPSKAPTAIPASHSLLKKFQEPGPYLDQFGYGVAVVQPLSKTQSCGVVLASSGTVRKLWAMKVCRDQTTLVPDVTEAVAYTMDSTLLKGLNLNGAYLGNSISVLDTLNTGERIVAVGAHEDGSAEGTKQGKVIIFGIQPTNLAMRVVSVLPEAYTGTDPVGSNLVAGEAFGFSITPIRGINGAKGLAVVSPQYAATSGASATGRVHLITLDNQYKATSETILAGTSALTVTANLYTIGSADFDHDGVSDLVLGYNRDNNGGLVAEQGSAKVVLMKADGTAKDSTYLRKGAVGFVDTSGYLAASCRFGSRIVATDFDGDGQVDLVVGSRGNLASAATDIVGSVWALRMKSLPWRRKALESIAITGTGWVGKTLSDFVAGNGMTWKLLPGDVQPDPVANCKLEGVGAIATVQCMAGGSNGTTSVKVVASDTGNIPASVRYADTMNFAIEVSGINAPPVQIKQIPTVVLPEDHGDTAVLKFSHYFEDPEREPMSFAVYAYDGTITNLIGHRLSLDKDSLFIKPVQFKNGVCSLRVVASDKFNISIEAKIRIEINHINHKPVANADAIKLTENSKEFQLDVIFNDRDDDNDPLVPVIIEGPKNGIATVSNGKILYTPKMFYVGPDSILYNAKDASVSSEAVYCKLDVTQYTGIPLVYMPLRDTTVLADADSIKIKADSLFFAGPTRFQFEIADPIEHTCQSLAKVSFDAATKTLILVPIKYRSGNCVVVLHDYVPQDVSSKMNLVVQFVPHPYRFERERLEDTLKTGEKKTIVLDSLDLDLAELEYVPGDGWKPWIKIDGNKLEFAPDNSSKDLFSTLMVRKKAAQGQPDAAFTDTLEVAITVNGTAGVRGRAIGGLRIDLASQPGNVVIHGGAEAFRAQIIGLRGERTVFVSGDPFQSRSVSCAKRSPNVFLRLEEGSRVTIVPLFLKR